MRKASPSFMYVNDNAMRNAKSRSTDDDDDRKDSVQHQHPNINGYFTEFTFSKGVFYGFVLVYVVIACLVILLEPILISNEMLHCEDGSSTFTVTAKLQAAKEATYENPLFRFDPCRYIRSPLLLWLTRQECSFGRSLVASVLLGGVVGWERREADRPAGIRTMALVSLGSCLFSINSAYGFLLGPMAWDASRVAAAIPSGVGFLGAGLIFQQADKDQETGDSTHVVHGLSTAASLWISSAVGVACAGELYFSALYSVALLLTVLRFGPRLRDGLTNTNTSPSENGTTNTTGYSSIDRGNADIFSDTKQQTDHNYDSELEALRTDLNLAKSVRFRAALSDGM